MAFSLPAALPSPSFLLWPFLVPFLPKSEAGKTSDDTKPPSCFAFSSVNSPVFLSSNPPVVAACSGNAGLMTKRLGWGVCEAASVKASNRVVVIVLLKSICGRGNGGGARIVHAWGLLCGGREMCALACCSSLTTITTADCTPPTRTRLLFWNIVRGETPGCMCLRFW